jgi:acid phosphatase
MGFLTTATLANCLLLTASVAHAADLDPTQQLGGNSPWFQGPDVNDIPYEVPDGCSVDMAAFVSRHGSRYPDQGAYNGWVALSAKVILRSRSCAIPLLTYTDPSCSVHRHRGL